MGLPEAAPPDISKTILLLPVCVPRQAGHLFVSTGSVGPGALVLDVTLKFLRDECNAWLAARFGVATPMVVLSRIIDEGGKYSFPQDNVALCLVNYEEDRVLRAQLPEHRLVNGVHVVIPPRLLLHLHVAFVSNHQQYDEALKHISYIMTMFQAQAAFNAQSHPALDARIERLVVEIQSLSFEQQNQMWACHGGKALPFVVYKVRVIPMVDDAPAAIQTPIVHIATETSRQ